MNPESKLLLSLAEIACLVVLLGGILTTTGTTVYFNNFDSGAASLNGLSIVDESGSAAVGIVSGQFRVDPNIWQNTYVMANTASFAAPYSSTLKNNPGTVTWAFNVSNQDELGFNNGFLFFLGSSSINPLVNIYTSSTYLLFGGALVENRMEFDRLGFPFDLPLEIPSSDGLGPLPSKGSFRITYEPSTDLWSVFGEVGFDYVDPATVTRLLGSVVDSSFTGVPLSYMGWGGQNAGTDFFDNVRVTVVPEPSTIVLVVFGLAAGAAFHPKAKQHQVA